VLPDGPVPQRSGLRLDHEHVPEPTQLFTWRDDTAADFTKPDAVMQGTIVEPSGFVGPVPYATGVVRIAGVQGDHIANAVTATWADVDLARTGVGFCRRC